MTGIKAATTEIVCSMDCDCTYDPHELINMIPLLTEDVDMVTASPYHKKAVSKRPRMAFVFIKRCFVALSSGVKSKTFDLYELFSCLSTAFCN